MGTLEYIDNHNGYLENAMNREPHGLQCIVFPYDRLLEAALNRARRHIMAQVRAGETNLHAPCLGFDQAQQLLTEVDKLMAFRGYTTTGYNVAQRGLSYHYMR